MATEGASHINDLDISKPAGATEQVDVLDDYHRQVKSVLQRDVNNFPGTALIYGEDASNTNAYVFTSALNILTYTAGMVVVLNVTNGNTGAVTLNIDSLGVKGVVALDGTALLAGEMLAGMNLLIYSGTMFVLVNSLANATLATLVGTQTLTNKTLTDPVINDSTTGAHITRVHDEDDMVSDAPDGLATQQSIKTYVDGLLGVHTFKSTALTDLSAGANHAPQAHGLGGIPDKVWCMAKCIVADSPFEVNNLVPVYQWDNGTSVRGLQVQGGITSVRGRNAANGVRWLNDSDGTVFNPTNGKWEMYIYAMKISV